MPRLSFGLLAALVIGLSAEATARTMRPADNNHDNPYAATAAPAYCATNHTVGKLVLSVTNYGVFAAEDDALITTADCFTGNRVLACEYPKRSGTQYAFSGAFWIGAVVGRDTLVSVGADGWQNAHEMFPDQSPFGDMRKRSIIDPEAAEFEGAVSEQDFIAVYTDTYTSGVAGLSNDFFGRPHIPLHVEVTQRSYAWSYPYADDFVLFDYSLRNIGFERLSRVYMGIYVDADCAPGGGLADATPGDLGAGAEFQDDICGFLETSVETLRVGNTDVPYIDTVNTAWIADVSGDLNDIGQTPLPAVTSCRIVRTPAEELDVSFNWWISQGDATQDFGPQAIATYRNFTTGGTGTPEGDVNKYYVLRNREFDYDQVFTGRVGPNDPTWLVPPVDLAQEFANGYDTRFLLSFGPFTIDPGQTLPISFAYVAGDNFHVLPNNANVNLGDSYNPEIYYANLNFDELSTNSRWASWVYDNPGVDTDTDGYLGKFLVVCDDTTGYSIDTSVVGGDTLIDTVGVVGTQCDTAYYEGDGVPDFRGASPPPAPDVWLIPELGRIRVRFNGRRSETTRDVFSRELDFEGYRVYLARDDREPSYMLLAAYDRENYNKFVYQSSANEYKLFDSPFTLDSLRTLYAAGDPNWDPLAFTRTRPYFLGIDSAFAFEAQGYNQSVFGVTTPIRKVYDDWEDLDPAAYGISVPDSVPDSLSFLLTDDGYFKYYEYEFIVDDLLPTVPYYVNVTAADYGSPASGLPSLETSKTVNSRNAYALETSANGTAGELDVYVWPNPYRADAGYLETGFEGRFSPYAQPIPDRERRIHFANLPPKCTISIFTLDGDLVRQFEHDMDPSDPNAMHDEWDLITRNTQMVVSGIYYFTVEEPNGRTQIGKIVIIM
ncbi:MAG: hypothetical protein RBT76_04435 [candidate division Zixibacteria bacterium]|nr:hypothetical protein [candidate division Zixibacteria bacterium]